MMASPNLPFVADAAAHILVVDDEPEIAESLADYLTKKEGYSISLAGNGQEAVRFLEESLAQDREIDLMLLDMRMPGMSGLEVLAWIREHQDLQYMRVVLLTAAAGSHEKVEALSAGADDYITKPYYPQELLARVKTILRTQQLEKQLQRQSQQLATLNRVAQAMAATLAQQEVLDTAVDGIQALLDVETAAALMIEGGLLRFQHIVSLNGRHPLTGLPAIPPDKSLLGTVFNQQTAVFLNPPIADPRYLPELDAPPGLTAHSMILAPLNVHGRPVGVLCGYNKQTGPFTAVELDLFVSLANAVGEAIENAWLFHRIRQRQQDLLENRNTLQALIDGIPHPIYTINDDWQIVSINQSQADQLEDEAEALAGQVCHQAFYQRDTPCHHCQASRALRQKSAQHWAVKWLGADHLPREWDVDAYPVPSTQAAAARVVILWQDRTDERRLENSLLQAGKLAAIGQLAAGVAHEINNPLTAVNANAQLLKMVIPPDDENYESVELIAKAGERATKVVRGLLDFARQEQYAFTATDVNRTIQQALELVHYQLQNANITITQSFADDLPHIIASAEHTKSVWLNLLVNARDAVLHRPEDRQIEITTRLDPEEEHVQVLFRDNGKGMTKAEAAHIFEPFYTTKDPGQGTGLGLATCHRIIEQHGGEIHALSEPDGGTTFFIRLPINPAIEDMDIKAMGVKAMGDYG